MSQIKEVLKNTFKSCLDIIRGDGITGDKALMNLSYLLILKLIEPHLSGSIDNYEYDFSDYDFSNIGDDNEKYHRTKLLRISRFSELAKEPADNLSTNIKYMWDDILSVHPSTHLLFMKGRGFDIVNQSTYKKIIDKLVSIDLSQTEYDVLGNSYEEVIKDVMTGKVLGQFFTQPVVKNLMVDMINPQLLPDGTMETCCDPTMGTGGFLISCMRHILKQSKDNAIQPDWEFITNQGLYGKEISPDTFQMAVSNMVISSGHTFKNLDCGDSLRRPIDKKFDIVLANPPFGIKGIKYDEFTSTIRDDYTPIKSDNAVSLFLQAIIYMLKVGGRCAVVLPNGKDLFSKDKGFVEVRKYLMKTCELREIIHLPSDVFENTSVKTCIFYFVKKCENAVKINYVKTKTEKVKGREYEFVSEHKTTSVKFYNYKTSDKTKTLLADVPIDKLEANSYSLNYAEYLEKVADVVSEGVVWKMLGEVCEIQNGKRIVKGQVETGQYPVLGGGGFTSFYTNEFSREGKTCKISREGMSLHNCVMILNEKYYLNSQALTVISNNQQIVINEYLWYYLNNNKEQVFNCGRGTAQKAIDIDEFKSIKIPIPSLEKQTQIVEYLDYIYEVANKTSRDKIAQLKRLNEICLKSVEGCETKLLGDVCDINPETMRLNQYSEINYIDISSVKGGQILEIQNLKTDFPSRAKRVIKKNDILYSSVRPNLKGYTYINNDIQNGIASTGFAQIRIKHHNTILSKYLYYILTTNEISELLISKAKGAQYPAVSFEEFENIKIPIPSLDKQKEIVDYCEANDLLIQSLENEMTRNETQAKNILTSVTKADTKPEPIVSKPSAIVETVKAEEPIVEVPKKIKLKIIVKNKVVS